MRPDVRTASGFALGIVVSAVLTQLGRPAALLLPVALLSAVALTVRTSTGGWRRAGIATLVGAGPGVILLATVIEVVGVTLPANITAFVLQLTWTAGSLTLGRSIATRIGRHPLTDVGTRTFAVGAVTAFVAGALVRLLGPGYDTAVRLAWILGEEDNAQIVGIAREVLVDGPRGAELAEQYGTAFVTLPLALLRMMGGPLGAETDVRLQAVTAFTVSAITAIAIAGLAMAVLSAIPQHIHGAASGSRSVTALHTLLGLAAAGITALVGFSLVVVIPLRTGFLTFVWGLAIVLLAGALTASTPADAPVTTRILLATHLVASGLLLLSSWPFIGPALIPLLLVPVLWIRLGAIRTALRRRSPLPWAGVILLASIGGTAVLWFLRWGPAAEVLSYGVDLLTVSGSVISPDPTVGQVAAVLAVLAVLAVVAGTRGRARTILLLGTIGPTVGAGLLYLGMRGAALVLTDGTLGYAGSKLLYGVLTVTVILGLATLSGQASRQRAPIAVGILLVVGFVHQWSPSATAYTDWWGRTLQTGALHAEAAVDAIQSTNADLPIRCLPSPGTGVTGTTRMAAYFCARWMEDAFNEGRFDGRRFDLLEASGPTFAETVDRITSEHEREYLFAHRMTMGRGWFGWDGHGG